jgi:hypothetical protein
MLRLSAPPTRILCLRYSTSYIMHDTFPKNVSQLALLDLDIANLGGSSSTQSSRGGAMDAAECIKRVKTMLFNSQIIPSEKRS